MGQTDFDKNGDGEPCKANPRVERTVIREGMTAEYALFCGEGGYVVEVCAGGMTETVGGFSEGIEAFSFFLLAYENFILPGTANDIRDDLAVPDLF